MKLLHTTEEIIKFDKLRELSVELNKLSIRYNNSELLEISERYNKEVQQELDKYLPFIGKEYLAPPSSFSDSKEWRKGKLESITHFNIYSKSVRGNFRYDNREFDGHSLLELKEIK